MKHLTVARALNVVDAAERDGQPVELVVAVVLRDEVRRLAGTADASDLLESALRNLEDRVLATEQRLTALERPDRVAGEHTRGKW